VSLFDTLRERAAEVVRRARWLRLDPEQADALAGRLLADGLAQGELDPAHHHLGSPEATLAYVVTLDAVNFGSGWFPHLRKRPGQSGYLTIASALRDRFERSGPWSAAELAGLSAADVARALGQAPAGGPAMELMEHFAASLRDLGRLLANDFDGSFARLVEAADQRAERLVALLARMPGYRDVARYDELVVPFYKRAQITAADLARAFAGEGPGHFTDFAQLTAFADNLVPHVLRCEGVLDYDAGLAARIDAGEAIASGSPEEVEIRAAAVVGVARVARALRERGHERTEAAVDGLLWTRGQRPAVKARPRHRTRCTFY